MRLPERSGGEIWGRLDGAAEDMHIGKEPIRCDDVHHLRRFQVVRPNAVQIKLPRLRFPIQGVTDSDDADSVHRLGFHNRGDDPLPVLDQVAIAPGQQKRRQSDPTNSDADRRESDGPDRSG